MSIKMTVHRVEQNGVCSLSGKEGEVLVVSFDDGTLNEGSLSQKSLMQLLRMKIGQNGNGQVQGTTRRWSHTEGISTSQSMGISEGQTVSMSAGESVGIGTGSSVSKPVAETRTAK